MVSHADRVLHPAHVHQSVRMRVGGFREWVASSGRMAASAMDTSPAVRLRGRQSRHMMYECACHPGAKAGEASEEDNDQSQDGMSHHFV